MAQPIKIKLNFAQRQALEPFFTEVRVNNTKGVQSAIMAQIVPDGMVIKVVDGAALEALMKALGSFESGERIKSVRPH